MKKITALLLTLSIQFYALMPLTALAVTEKTNVQPKQFKSMASKNKKQSEDYKYDYLNMQWWDEFNDPILSSYIIKAVQNNHDLKMATINVEEYYQNMKLQFSSELPQVGVGFAPNYLKMPGTTSSDWSFAVPALVSYEADIFLKNRDKTKSAKKLHETAKLDERAAYISIVSAVGTIYFNLVKTDKMIELQEEIVNSRQQIYDLMLARNKEGLTSTADTIRANKSLVAGNTDLTELKKQREQLLNRLAVLTGDSPANIAEFKRASLDSLSNEMNFPTEISSEVIMQRPDYIKAEKMVEKAGIDVRVARKEFLPSISISGLALFNASDFGSIFTTKNMLWAIGASALLPIFTGGKKIANLKLKKATYERILENYYKTNLVAMQEVNDALVAVKLDNGKMHQTLKQAQLEADDYHYNELKYNEGVISKLDLIQFKENLLSMNKVVAQQKVECMVSYISLYKAAGSKL